MEGATLFDWSAAGSTSLRLLPQRLSIRVRVHIPCRLRPAFLAAPILVPQHDVSAVPGASV